MRVQAGYNPVLIADRDYWDANKTSDTAGDWPANVPVVKPNQTLTRTLDVYNDTFSGTAVDVFWELHEGSATGSIVASGQMQPNITLGYVYSNSISFTFPNAADGTLCYLVLYTQKSGVEMFRETAGQFMIKNELMLGGVPFGASPPYETGSEFDKASDGNLSTFYDFANANGGYTGIDLGAGSAAVISSIVYSPRSGFESRMVGGVFQGSNDGTNYTALYTVTAVPSPNTRVTINNATASVSRICWASQFLLQYRRNGLLHIGGQLAHVKRNRFWPGPSLSSRAASSTRQAMNMLQRFYDFSNASGGYTGIDFR